MSERALKQLVGALALAVGVWLVATLFSSGSGSIAPGREIGGFFDGATGPSVAVVRLTGPAGTVALERAGGDSWTANGFPASEEAVARLLVEFGRASVGDLVATNPENHDRMGVSADSAIVLQIDVDGASRTLLVGDNGRRFGTAYVRLPEVDDVYLMEADIRNQIDRDVDAWRDRTMATIDSSTVARVEVTRADDTYVVLRGDTAWTFEGGGAVTASAVTGILAELSNLIATGFVVEGDSIGSADREVTTRAYSESGELLGVIAFGEGAGDRWATTDRDDYVYRVSSFRANRVAPTRQDIEPGS